MPDPSAWTAEQVATLLWVVVQFELIAFWVWKMVRDYRRDH